MIDCFKQAKHMEPWLKTAMEGLGPLLECKLVRVRSFAHILRRYTSLNHLARFAPFGPRCFAYPTPHSLFYGIR